MQATPRRLAQAFLLALLTVSAPVAVVAPAHAALVDIPAPDPDADPATSLGEYANRVIKQINDQRAKRDIPKIPSYDECVDRLSNRWARHLAEIEGLEHRDLSGMIDSCNLEWAGETVIGSAGYYTPKEAVDAWMDSPPHKEILMSRKARFAGVGFAYYSDGGLYGVVNLARR